jgi:hypothetical protein
LAEQVQLQQLGDSCGIWLTIPEPGEPKNPLVICYITIENCQKIVDLSFIHLK